jgi:hypothetical protein
MRPVVVGHRGTGGITKRLFSLVTAEGSLTSKPCLISRIFLKKIRQTIRHFPVVFSLDLISQGNAGMRSPWGAGRAWMAGLAAAGSQRASFRRVPYCRTARLTVHQHDKAFPSLKTLTRKLHVSRGECLIPLCVRIPLLCTEYSAFESFS